MVTDAVAWICGGLNHRCLLDSFAEQFFVAHDGQICGFPRGASVGGLADESDTRFAREQSLGHL